MEKYFRKLALFLIFVVMGSFCGECRNPVLHRVGGGKNTWTPSINFTDWSTHEQFYVGDWLYFGFDKHVYNVLEVNKTGFENCIERNFITNITRGGRDVFNLTEARQYYFLCGRGHCFKGMKVAVDVHDYQAPTPPAAPFVVTNGNPPADICSMLIQLVLLAPALVCSFLFNYV
ncbi:Lamin-like protein [Morella rubra]|uniref:Lamin-like protein n=1 Tax=Morella rubra TaxID=262757 RepID=A0A6A1WV12_9ROSI|nr:Lamin-like protein [Morella rubra]